MAHLALAAAGHIVVDIVAVGFQLSDLRVGDGQALPLLGLGDDEQFLDIDGVFDFQWFSIDSQFHLISSSLSSADRAARRVAATGCGVFSRAPLRKKARGKPRSRHLCHAPHASRRLSLSNDLRRTVQSYNNTMFSKTLLTL